LRSLELARAETKGEFKAASFVWCIITALDGGAASAFVTMR
jgi:hypothetical protein